MYFFTGTDGAEQSVSRQLVGLPVRGMAVPVRDTTTIGTPTDSFTVTNIGANDSRSINFSLLIDRSLVLDSVFSVSLETDGIASRTAYVRIATTSVVGTDERPFTIAPNPVQGVVRLQFPTSIRRALRIVDALGRLAYTTTTELRELVIPVSALGVGAAFGMYMVSVADAAGIHNTSFVVTP